MCVCVSSRKISGATKGEKKKKTRKCETKMNKKGEKYLPEQWQQLVRGGRKKKKEKKRKKKTSKLGNKNDPSIFAHFCSSAETDIFAFAFSRGDVATERREKKQ
ncbi:hypothetical protein CEXT_696581 [Caerostris extrusa]|uniref:Uncharacterized protein n=1 Tax=Caerostris extrusa TaxID=172846 RepID=A0AAV4PR44_CAEEX|nr:hypothetical protein CEXT_696581 [Caerostris extrusa]